MSESEGLTPEELWAQITALPRPSRNVDLPFLMPGTKEAVGEVAIVPLTQEEELRCNAGAEKWAQKLLGEDTKLQREAFGYESVYTGELAVQVVYYCCRMPGELTRHAFHAPSVIRNHFTADQVSVMFRHYVTVKAELGPIITQMSERDMRDIIARLDKGGSSYPFDLLSPDAQSHLLTFMASQLTSFWTGTSSPGSQPESDSERASSDDEVVAVPEDEEVEEVTIDDPPTAE